MTCMLCTNLDVCHNNKWFYGRWPSDHTPQKMTSLKREKFKKYKSTCVNSKWYSVAIPSASYHCGELSDRQLLCTPIVQTLSKHC